LRDFIQRQPIGDFRKCPAKFTIWRSPAPSTMIPEPRSARREPERTSIASAASAGAFRALRHHPGAARRSRPTRTGHGGIRRHSAAERHGRGF
jgi:hypothetical protein